MHSGSEWEIEGVDWPSIRLEWANGNHESALQKIERAKNEVKGPGAHRIAARFAEMRGEFPEALEAWRKVLATEPARLDANQACFSLLQITQGKKAASAFLTEQKKRFPFNFSLLEWIANNESLSDEERIAAWNQLIELDSSQIQHRYNRLRFWVRKKHFMEARAELGKKESATISLERKRSLLGVMAKVEGRDSEALDHFKKALAESVEDPVLWENFGDLELTESERRELLFVALAEGIRQTAPPPFFHSWLEKVSHFWEPREIRASLQLGIKQANEVEGLWSVMVRQFLSEGQMEEASSHAQQALAIWPNSAVLWLDLSTVTREAGEWHKTILALEKVVSLRPENAEAGRRLAEAWQQVDDWNKAEEVLRQALARNPMDAYHYGALAYLHWESERREEAVRELLMSLKFDSSYEWGWSVLPEWIQAPESPWAQIDFVKQLLRVRSGEPHLWRYLARIDLLPYQEKLAAWEKVIQLDPGCVEAWEQRVDLLMRDGKSSEALKACEQEEVKETPAMKARAIAWSTEVSLADRAVKMKELLDQYPDLEWGWRTLAYWCLDLGKIAEAVQTANQWQRLSPGQAEAHQLLGQAKLLMDDRRGAKIQFSQAWVCGAANADVLYALIQLHLEAEELSDAELYLQKLKMVERAARVRQCEGQLALAKNEDAQVMAALSDLCFAPAQEGASVRVLTEALFEKNREKEVSRLLESLLSKPGLNPEVGSLWVQSWVRQDQWEFAGRLQQLSGNSELESAAFVTLLQAVGDYGKEDLLKKLIVDYEARLRSRTAWWGLVGRALLQNNDYDRVIDWMKDWNSRKDIESWMLLNLAVALRSSVKTYPQSAKVSQHALQLASDSSWQYHTLWLALDDALDGDMPEAIKKLRVISPTDLNPFYAVLFRLTRGVVDVLRAPPDQKKNVTERTLARMRDESIKFPETADNAVLKLAMRLGKKQMQSEEGCGWQRLKSLLKFS